MSVGRRAVCKCSCLMLTFGAQSHGQSRRRPAAGLLVPTVFAKLKRDPAIGNDETMTLLSDTISMTIYLFVASVILFS